MPELSPKEWAALRRDYIAKRDLLMNGSADFLAWEAPYDFYRDLFPKGFLEEQGKMVDWNEPGGGKPNAIILEITDETRPTKSRSGKPVEKQKVHRYTMTDDLDALDTVTENSSKHLWSVYTSPISYFGKARNAANARYLHAFAIDLDGVAPDNLDTLLFQAKHGTIPCPTEIVISGSGVHVYYRLAEPVPLVPDHIPALQHLKRYLTVMVWNEYTSTIPCTVLDDKRQYQGIYQPFRIPGTSTKLNGSKDGQKRKNEYPALAFRIYSRGPWKLDELVDALHGVDAKTRRTMKEEFAVLWKTAGRTPLERAKVLWPDWYERRVVRGEDRQFWPEPVNRGAYESWRRRIADEVGVGHRYNAIRTLAAYAVKCGIDYNELEDDALCLFERYSRMPSKADNLFTMGDLYAALDTYEDPDSKRFKNEYMANSAGIKPRQCRRNGRRQDIHLKMARSHQEILDMENGTNWRDGNGRPPGSGTKKQLVLDYAADHPGESQRKIAAALGISPATVNKWLKERGSEDGE